MKIFSNVRGDWANITAQFAARRLSEPGLSRRGFFAEMLCSAYLSYRWLGPVRGRFSFWSLRYWLWLAQYSSLHELSTRAALAQRRASEAASPEEEPSEEVKARVTRQREWAQRAGFID